MALIIVFTPPTTAEEPNQTTPAKNPKPEQPLVKNPDRITLKPRCFPSLAEMVCFPSSVRCFPKPSNPDRITLEAVEVMGSTGFVEERVEEEDRVHIYFFFSFFQKGVLGLTDWGQRERVRGA